MVGGKVLGLGVVVPPGSEHVVPLALARAPVHLDLHSAHLQLKDMVRRKNSPGLTRCVEDVVVLPRILGNVLTDQ